VAMPVGTAAGAEVAQGRAAAAGGRHRVGVLAGGAQQAEQTGDGVCVVPAADEHRGRAGDRPLDRGGHRRDPVGGGTGVHGGDGRVVAGHGGAGDGGGGAPGAHLRRDVLVERARLLAAEAAGAGGQPGSSPLVGLDPAGREVRDGAVQRPRNGVLATGGGEDRAGVVAHLRAPRAVERGGGDVGRDAGGEHGQVAHAGPSPGTLPSPSLPGLSRPFGSSACLTRCSTSQPTSPSSSARYGARRRPMPWW
jgi:hypothetical protein